MKLYTVPLAPNPTKVMLYVAEREQLGVRLDLEQVVVNTLKGRHKEPEHLARNPFGTLPVLELDDGSYLIESLTILEYLEEQFPERGLLVGGPRQRAQARQLERLVELKVALPMMAWVHATKSPLGWPADPEIAAERLERMQPALDHLETLLADGRELLFGSRVSIADCTLASALQFVRYVEGDLLGERPHLRAWDERYRERPAARAVLRW